MDGRKQKAPLRRGFSFSDSGGEGGLHALDNRLQWRFGLILLGVEALGVLGDAVLVHQREAEAVLALGLDDAVQRSEGYRKGANRLLDMRGGFHCLLSFQIGNGPMTVEIVKSSGCTLRMQKACDRNMAANGNLRVGSRQSAVLGKGS